MNYYFDMEDEVLFKMLEELRASSGDPLDKRALMNYCYPNPTLPEDDFELKEIYHGIYNAEKNSIDITIIEKPEQEAMTFVLYK